jgi:hypothetical protein
MLALVYKKFSLIKTKYSEYSKIFDLGAKRKKYTTTRNDGNPSSDNDNLICIPDDNEYYDEDGDGEYYEQAIFVLTDSNGEYIKDSHFEFYYNKNRIQKTAKDVI